MIGTSDYYEDPISEFDTYFSLYEERKGMSPVVNEPCNDVDMEGQLFPKLDEIISLKSYTDLTSAAKGDQELPETSLGVKDYVNQRQLSNIFSDTSIVQWKEVNVAEWTNQHVIAWIWDTATEKLCINQDDVYMGGFSEQTGKQMLQMCEKDFKNLEPTYGSGFYQAFQELQNSKQDHDLNFLSQLSMLNDISTNPLYMNQLPMSPKPTIQGPSIMNAGDGMWQYNNIGQQNYLINEQERMCQNQHRQENSFQSTSSAGCSSESESEVPQPVKKTRGPGRPKKPKKPKSNHSSNRLWEFVRDLLLNNRFNPSLIKWEDETTGVFRIVQSAEIAKLWGHRKNNPKMTYEKMSRALRTYYASGLIIPAPKDKGYPKKLVYMFGSTATGWKKWNMETSTLNLSQMISNTQYLVPTTY